MNPSIIAAIIKDEVAAQTQTQTPEGCINENIRAMDGTGAHLGLRDPWYNSLSHQITDNTVFRLLLIVMVVDWVIKKL